MELINSSFNQKDAQQLLENIIKAKITFHESKIEKSSNEEDIKMRENRIKQLQENFKNFRDKFENSSEVKIKLSFETI